MVKTYQRPPMRDLGDGKAFLTVSTSNPTRRHVTVVLETPLAMSNGIHEVVCSCPGWINHKHCWHADEATMHYRSEENPESFDHNEDTDEDTETKEDLEQKIENLKDVIREMASAEPKDAHVTAKFYTNLWEKVDGQGSGSTTEGS